jgi:hypothetical protein
MSLMDVQLTVILTVFFRSGSKFLIWSDKQEDLGTKTIFSGKGVCSKPGGCSGIE